MAAPSAAGGVTAVVIAPKSRLFESIPSLGCSGSTSIPTSSRRTRFDFVSPRRSRATPWPGDAREASCTAIGWFAREPAPRRRTSRSSFARPNALIQRGSLIVLLDLGIVGAAVAGERHRRRRRRTLVPRAPSHLGAQLSRATVARALRLLRHSREAFAIWSYSSWRRTPRNRERARPRDAARAAPPPTPLWLPAESDRLDTPLFSIAVASCARRAIALQRPRADRPLLVPDVELKLALRDEGTTRGSRSRRGAALFGYRAFNDRNAIDCGRRAGARRRVGARPPAARPRRARALRDRGGRVRRALVERHRRPTAGAPDRHVAASRALIAGGARTPRSRRSRRSNSVRCSTAFRRMAADLNASRSALEEAQRRTAAVLRNVASGVVAVDLDGRVSLANPRAETLLGGALAPGAPFTAHAPARSRPSLSVFSSRGRRRRVRAGGRPAATARHAHPPCAAAAPSSRSTT